MTQTTRTDGRAQDAIRPTRITPDYSPYAEGSALIEMGNTHVLCNASLENNVPRWLKGKQQGWITAEYGMLPRATHQRTRREATLGRPSPRSQEIGRLIGRALRQMVDLSVLGERTLYVDCDVLLADGGTRCAAITGAAVACALALRRAGICDFTQVAAVSVGLQAGDAFLDLCYEEDSCFDTDCNFVMDAKGRLVEIQGTAERAPFEVSALLEMTHLAQIGITRLIALQDDALACAQ